MNFIAYNYFNIISGLVVGILLVRYLKKLECRYIEELEKNDEV